MPANESWASGTQSEADAIKKAARLDARRELLAEIEEWMRHYLRGARHGKVGRAAVEDVRYALMRDFDEARPKP